MKKSKSKSLMVPSKSGGHLAQYETMCTAIAT